MQNNTSDLNDLEKPGHRNRRSGFDVSPRESYKVNLPGMVKPRANYSSATISRNKVPKRQTCDGIRNRAVSNERDQHYKIFLESAQRALEDMRKKQKASSLIRMGEDEGNYRNQEPEFGSVNMGQQHLQSNGEWNSNLETEFSHPFIN